MLGRLFATGMHRLAVARAADVPDECQNDIVLTKLIMVHPEAFKKG